MRQNARPKGDIYITPPPPPKTRETTETLKEPEVVDEFKRMSSPRYNKEATHMNSR